MADEKTFKDRFIEGVRIYMAKHQVPDVKAMAPLLGMQYMALYKVMSGPNNPTVEVCCNLCRLGGYSANWLFLGLGVMVLEEQVTLNEILKTVKGK